MRGWFVRGDVDGFFALALDNLVQLLLIDGLCRFVLGFPAELVNGRILPGVAISLIIGNVFYGWQARRLMQQSGRDDICALPYGINTVSLFAHVFLVMLVGSLQNIESAEAAGDSFPTAPSLAVNGIGTVAAALFGSKFQTSDLYMVGGFALEQGFIFTSIIWAALTVAIIERKFSVSALWALAGAALCAVGLMHSYQFTPGDVVVKLAFAGPWVWGYLAVAALMFLAPYVTEPDSAGHGVGPTEESL